MKEHNPNCGIKHIPIELASCTCGISNTMTYEQILKEFDAETFSGQDEAEKCVETIISNLRIKQ